LAIEKAKTLTLKG